MKTVVKILVVFFLGISSVNAQFSIIYGKKRIAKTKGSIKLIGGDNTGLYSLKISNEGTRYHILVVKNCIEGCTDEFVVEIESEKIQSGLRSTSSTMNISAFLTKGKVFVFFEAFDKKNKEQKLFLQTVSSNGSLSDVFEIYTLNLKDVADPKLNSLFPNFRIEFTENKDFFWICPMEGKRSVYSKSFSDKISVSVFKSSNFEKQFTREINIEQLTKDASYISKLEVVDNGTILLTSIKKTHEEKYASLIVINNNSPAPKHLKLDIPTNQYLLDYSYRILNNGDILMAALVTDTVSIAGVLDKANPKIMIKRIDGNTFFDLYSKTINVEASLKNKLATILDNRINFDFLKIMEFDDALMITMEYQNIPRRSVNSFYGYANTSSLDLLMFKCSGNGELLWAKNIPKNQRTVPSYTLDAPVGKYDLFLVDNKLKLVFEENSANSKLGYAEPSVNYLKNSKASPTNIVMLTIDKYGMMKKEVIFQNIYKETNYMYSKPFDGNTHLRVLYFENKKEDTDMLGLLKFE